MEPNEQEAIVQAIAELQAKLDAKRDWIMSGVIPTNDSKVLFGTDQMLIDQLTTTGDINDLVDYNFTVPVDYWVHFQSTYVHRAGWWETGYNLETGRIIGSIFVEYLSLAVFRYDNTDMHNWQDMIASISHGRYAYYILHKWPTQSMLRTSQRIVTKEMREANFKRETA